MFFNFSPKRFLSQVIGSRRATSAQSFRSKRARWIDVLEDRRVLDNFLERSSLGGAAGDL
jgi:hypothetical protein